MGLAPAPQSGAFRHPGVHTTRCLPIFPLAVSVMLLLAGCGRGTTPSDGAGTPGDQAEAVAQAEGHACEPGKGAWRAGATPQRGGILRRAYLEPGHLDVSAPSQHPGAIPQVYGQLVRPRGCFFEDVVMAPGLARSWQVSPDGLTWTFKLRDDIRWHNRPPVNGRPFTSADVAWTIEYVKRSGGGLRSYWQEIGHAEPDPHTVILQLKEPQADFLGRLGDHQNVILPREVQDQYGSFKAVAIGTGPFMLKEYRPNQAILVERNPDWPDKGADGQQLPYIDAVHSVILGDYAAEVAAMRAGQLDIGPSFRKADFDALRQANLKLRPYQTTNAAVFGLFMNLSRGPFQDVRVRKAVALSIDPSEIIASYSNAAVPTGFLPAALRDYAWPPEKASGKFKPDYEKARSLLLEAGHPAGRLQFLIKTTRSYAQDTELVQQQLQRAGISTQMAVEPVANTREILTTGNYEAAWGNPATATFVPDRWLGSFLRTGGSENVIQLSDPVVDALSLGQAREMDPTKRRQVIDQLQDRLYDIMPFVPTASRVFYRLYSCRLQNMPPPSYSLNMEGLAGAWLDPSGC